MVDNKTLFNIILIFTVFLAFILGIDYIFYNQFKIPSDNPKLIFFFNTIYHKLHRNIFYERAIYVVLLTGINFLAPNFKLHKNETAETKDHFVIYAISLSAVFILGYSQIMIYSIFLYPLVFLVMHYYIAKAIQKLRKNRIKHDDGIGLNQGQETEFSLEWYCKDLYNDVSGFLRVHNPFQGFWIEGGAGSGKSKSLFEPIIFQTVQKGFSAVIYEAKGNPAPLSHVAYHSLLYKKKYPNNRHAMMGKKMTVKLFKKDITLPWNKLTYEVEVKFAFMNFVNMEQTVRVNVLSKRYIHNEYLLDEMCNLIMKNLERSWIQKTDFWANNAIALLKGVITMFQRNKPEYLTLPHVISALLTDYRYLMNWMITDGEVKKLILPIYTAYMEEAKQQVAGAVSSVELPFIKLYNKNIYWVFSKDEFDLDISNKKNPKYFCIANELSMQEGVSPCISITMQIIMNLINMTGKNKVLFGVDELPTLFINPKKLAQLPATGRSNKNFFCISVQLYEQLVEQVGQSLAKVIAGNCGTQFYGMSSEEFTQKKVVELFGKKRVYESSVSTSENGQSETESSKWEPIFQNKDIAGQKKGEFKGKVADGEPFLFNVQTPLFTELDEFEHIKIPEFALPKGLDREQGKAHIDKLVEENFIRINKEVEELLNDYKERDITRFK